VNARRIDVQHHIISPDELPADPIPGIASFTADFLFPGLAL